MKTNLSPTRRAVAHLQAMTHRTHALLPGRAAAGIWAALKVWAITNEVVLIPANTCYIVLWAVLKSGNRPLLVDVDPQTGNLATGGLNAALAYNPAVVIPCHLYGLPAPMRSIVQWAKTHNINVIEDAALALGANVDGQPAGSWGDASILSFGLGKIADNQVGGALLSDDAVFIREAGRVLAGLPLWDDRLMALTNQWNSLYWSLHQYETANPRLLDLYPQLFAIYGELTAYRLAADDWAELPKLLRHLPDNLAHRADITAVYDQHLTHADSTLLPALARPAGSVLWRYPLLVAAHLRNALLGSLWEQGVHDATRWYPPLRPMTAALAPHSAQPTTPAADALGASIINLPLDERTTVEEAARIAALVNAFLSDQEH
ncbi:MAG: DegT/DnrJ/EryC1/StrS family aminotransferase [Chloroflexi bacterium]|nr:DegT/DnrJ/EryC1/StrS family aminotransferase [Chloroflexota bacterium]MCC6892090.1 DegT/DnrJ/EryC1/StrS aminotransferase family protein [Anaerolineae bacterium]